MGIKQAQLETLISLNTLLKRTFSFTTSCMATETLVLKNLAHEDIPKYIKQDIVKAMEGINKEMARVEKIIEKLDAEIHARKVKVEVDDDLCF